MNVGLEGSSTMHELPVTEKILDIVLRHAAQNKVRKIHSITLKVGGLADLQEKWLQRYFDYLSRETIARGARLIVIRGMIRLRCGACATVIETEEAMQLDRPCPQCGATRGFSILSGREYGIEEMVAE